MVSARRKKYIAFVADPESLPKDEPVCLVIKDLTPGRRKYDARFVKAVLSSSDERLPDSDTLFLSSFSGRAYPHALAIKVLEDLGEYVPGSPYSRHAGFFPAKGSK